MKQYIENIFYITLHFEIALIPPVLSVLITLGQLLLKYYNDFCFRKNHPPQKIIYK